MSYKFAGEKDGVFMIQHPDGSLFKVAKGGLTAKNLQQIQKLPKTKKMADGGEVEEEDDESAGDKKPLEIEPVVSAESEQGSQPAPAGNAPTAGSDAFVGPMPVQGPRNVPSDSPLRNPLGIPGPVGQVLGQGEAAQTEIGRAKSKESEQVAGAYQQFLNTQPSATTMAAQQKLINDQMTANITGRNNLTKAINDGTIDPHRLWNNMSTPAKITSMISVFLGGVGGAMTHQPNQALAMFNHSIDQDIEAQRADLGKKETLLSRNLQEYGDLKQAEMATRLQYNTVLQAQVAKIAAQSGVPIQIQQSKLLNTEMEKQALPMLNQLSLAQTQSKILGGGGGTGGIPAGSPQDIQLMQQRPEYAKSRVQIGGSAYQARDPKAAEDLTKMESLYEPIKSDIMLLKSFGPAESLDPQNRARVQATMNRLAMAVNEFNGYKRFTDMDSEAIKAMFNDPTQVGAFMKGQGATNDTVRALEHKLESTRQHSVIGYQGKDLNRISGPVQ